MRLLFVRGGALGDFVLSLGVLERLLAAGAVVDVACDPRRRPLLERVPGAEGLGELYPLDDARQAWIVGGGRAPRSWAGAVAWTRLAAEGLPRAGLPLVGHAELPRPALPAPPSGPAPGPPAPPARSVYEQVHDALLPLVAAGLVPDAPAREPRLRRLPGDPAPDGRAWLAPGSGGQGKRPPLAWWDAVAAALSARGVPVGWLAGPVEAEQAWAREPGRGVRAPDLGGLVALLAGAGVLLGPDSGPGHLAAALRRGEGPRGERAEEAGASLPVGVVFRATEPAVWAPPGARVFGPRAAAEEVAAWAAAALGAGP